MKCELCNGNATKTVKLHTYAVYNTKCLVPVIECSDCKDYYLAEGAEELICKAIKGDKMRQEYKVFYSYDDGCFVAINTRYPSCSYLAKTSAAALDGMRDLVKLIEQDIN